MDQSFQPIYDAVIEGDSDAVKDLVREQLNPLILPLARCAPQNAVA